MKALMFDLETLAIPADSAIISIGAVIFDQTAAAFEVQDDFYKTIKSQQGRVIDQDTLWWWMQQTDRSLFNPNKADHLADVLESFAEWVLDHKPEEVWCKGMDFDVATINHAFAGEGIKSPWHYRAPNDLRTVGKLYPLITYNKGEDHNALEDARIQAEWCWRLMREHTARLQEAASKAALVPKL